MRIYPAVHYTMGGLWVDYDLQTTDPGPVRDRRGQLLRPRRQPARRLRADAGPGRRLLRPAVHHQRLPRPATRTGRGRRRAPGGRRRRWPRPRTGSNLLLAVDGDRTPDSFHRELGELMWEYCGMARTDDGPAQGARPHPADPRGVLAAHQGAGHRRGVQPVAGEGQPRRRLPGARRADVPRRAAPRRVLRRPLPRGVARPPDGEAARDDEEFSYAAAWEFTGTGEAPVLHKEDLVFEYVHPTQRSYA